MKRLLWCLLLLTCVVSCQEKKTVAPEPVPVVEEDSVVAVVDTTAVVEEEIDPPKSADELFNDFIYGFMTNRKFQRARIRFPLVYEVNGRVDSIMPDEWDFDRLYSEKEVYTVIYGKASEEEKAKSTSLSHVVVEWIELTRRRVKSYEFDRGPRGWMLTALRSMPLGRNENASFLIFYQRFATDSVFQREHVTDPVAFKTYDSENFEEISGVVDIDQWFLFRPDLPHDVITNIRYGQSYKGSKFRIVAINSLSSSMFSYLTFEREGDTWMLVAFEN